MFSSGGTISDYETVVTCVKYVAKSAVNYFGPEGRNIWSLFISYLYIIHSPKYIGAGISWTLSSAVVREYLLTTQGRQGRELRARLFDSVTHLSGLMTDRSVLPDMDVFRLPIP